MANTKTSVHTTIQRFTVQDGYQVLFMDVLDAGHLAVAGSNNGKKNTFIDLFMFHFNADSQEKTFSLMPEPYFSQEFTEFGSTWRSVCLLDDRLFLTCCKDTIASYDSRNGDLVNQGKFNGRASCMITRDVLVYVGLRSKEVIVLDARNLRIKETISLKRLEVGDWPSDITVSNNKLFICTGYDRALMYNSEGEIEYEYTNTHYRYARSITVSKEKGLIFILWTDGGRSRQVVVYSPSGGHSPISGGHILASFKVSDNFRRIRINNNTNRLFLVTQTTGEVYEYHTSDIFTFDNLLIHSESLIEKDDCRKLLDYFEVPAKESEAIIKSVAPFSTAIHHLREAGKVSVDYISHLITACSEKGLSKLVAVLTVYQQAQVSKLTKKVLKDQLKALEDKKQELSHKLTESEDEKQQLRGRLKTSQEIRTELNRRLMITDMELEYAKSSLRATKDELVKSQLEHAKESMALQEVLKLPREALKQASYAFVAEEETLLEEHETPDVSQQSILAADYGRLVVNVANNLTLDSTLKLATLFGLPPAETDMLRRVSLKKTPGMTLINFMKTRNIINMYDVTNLQKGLVYIQLNQTNENLLAPYQSKVDPFQFEDNQAPELLAWPVENVSFVPDEKSTPSQGSDEREEYHDHSKETLLERTKKEELPNQRKDSKIIEIRHHHSYIEHVIKCEGGTISIMGVHLTIPEDALSFDNVIAVKVIYDHDIHLPRSARRGRMTPLLKLEPEGLTLNKPAQLTIPHSAVIPKPDRHDVIIFTGLKDKEHSQEGEITWTEEKSIDWKLYPEKISLNIDILSYVFVNLVRQETEQKHIFRIVPFIDGILDAKDDVFITVCFCKDSDEDYKLLLEDHQSKLSLGNYTTFQVTRTLNDGRDYASYNDLMMSSPGESYHLTKEESKLLLEDHQSKLTLGNYTTFQVTRTLNDGRDYASYIDLMMSSPGESYHLTKEESTKHVDIDHLCATSRVSHQFRLKRNNDGDNDMVDVKLKVSQHEENQTALILQSKVKDILLSPESQEILFRDLHQDLHKYEKLRGDIAKLLDKQHCLKLGGYFELTLAENETIQTAAESGKMLMKILDDRELIMPDRMIGMYEGLKATDFDEVARLVLEYIGTLQEKNGKENKEEKDDMKMVNIAEKQKVISKREPKLSVCFKILIEEGYKRLDVQRALKLSHGKLDLGRRILLLAKEEHDILPSNPLQMELWVNKDGGLLELPDTGVSLEIPPGALEKDQLIQMRIIPYNFKNDFDLSFTSNSSVVVELLPSNLKLLKLAKLTLPHCLVLKKGCEWKAKIYSSHHEEGTQPLWRPQPDTPYVLTERNCVIKLKHFSWEKFEIGDEIVEGKRIVLYAAKDMSSSQSMTLIHVGYYLDLPEGEMVVSINEVSFLVRKSAVFFKDGMLPLKCHYDRIEPQYWTHCAEKENPKEITFKMAATSIGLYCTFALHIKEGTLERGNRLCYFKAGQGSQLAELLFILKDGEKDSRASSSDKCVGTGISQSQKKTCDESPTVKQPLENIDREVTEDILRELSGEIPDKWKEVGRNLGLKNSELSIIKKNNDLDHKETVYQMLLTWKERNGSGATYRKLGEALNIAGRKDLQLWLYDQATIQDDNLS
ncbi:uncharacterized protein [Apostichopus japonicus]|uniref:uncharacterized protein isoform X2 n=1 Tax=Stichopus japonicus TaxID=307972 RepID=UPI003AB67EEF